MAATVLDPATIDDGALRWWAVPNASLRGAWGACDPTFLSVNETWLPAHFLAAGGRLWALGLRRAAAVRGLVRGDVLASSDGGVTWGCAGRTGAVVRAGAAAFAMAAPGGSPPLLCVAGGRRLNGTVDRQPYPPDAAAFLADEARGVYLAPTSDVSCSPDGGATWSAAAPLPEPVVGLTAVSIPLSALPNAGPLLLGGWRGEGTFDPQPMRLLVPRLSAAERQLIGWAALPTNGSGWGPTAGSMATWLPASQKLLFGSGQYCILLGPPETYFDSEPVSAVLILSGCAITLPCISMLAADLLPALHSDAHNVTFNDTGLFVGGAPGGAVDEFRARGSFTVSAVGVGAASGPTTEAVVDAVYYFNDERVLQLFLPPGALYDKTPFRAVVNYEVPGASALPSFEVPASALATPQWADPRFGHVLAADPRSGQLMRASPVRCQPPAACAAGVGYSGACTASPFDAPCLRCRACRAGQEFVSTACSAQADAVCAPCPPCAAGLSVLVACGAPGAPANEHVCGVPPRAGDLLLLQPRELVIVGSVVGVEAVLACALLAGLLWRRRREAAAVGEAPARRETQRDWQGASPKKQVVGAAGRGRGVRQAGPLAPWWGVAALSFTTMACATLMLAVASHVVTQAVARPLFLDALPVALCLAVPLLLSPVVVAGAVALLDRYDSQLRLAAAMWALPQRSTWLAVPAAVGLWRPQLLGDLLEQAAASPAHRSATPSGAHHTGGEAAPADAASLNGPPPSPAREPAHLVAAVRAVVCAHTALVDVPLLAAAVWAAVDASGAASPSGAIVVPCLALLAQALHVCWSLYCVGAVHDSSGGRLGGRSAPPLRLAAPPLPPGEADEAVDRRLAMLRAAAAQQPPLPPPPPGGGGGGLVQGAGGGAPLPLGGDVEDGTPNPLRAAGGC